MIKKKLVSCFSATVATVVITSNAYAAEITFPDVPLFLKEELAPNVILTLDNSTSMQRADIFDASVYCPDVNPPDGGPKTVLRTCWTDPNLNKIYYNPDIVYELPIKADGSTYPNAIFSEASVDGFDENAAKINLGEEYVPTYNYLRREGEVPLHEFVDFELNNKRAYYATFDGSIDPDTDTAYNECNDVAGNNYNSELADSCFVINNIEQDEEQNFANWYSYYRNRLLVTKSAASIAFDLVGGDIRVGWNDINILKEFNLDNANYVSPFTSQHKVNFYDWLADMEQDFGTPLIAALRTVGTYVSSTDHINPFAVSPGTPIEEYDPATDLSCRQNYNVMFTDGAWTYNSGIEVADNDFDNISRTLPDGTVFSAGTPPYSAPSPAAGYLSDWAFYYWATDLRPDLDDTLTPFFSSTSNMNASAAEQFFNPANDPATWQHLVNYTVSLGVDGKLAHPESLEGLIDGSIEWFTDGGNEGTRIDDTWHTAINSRGDYFSASNTTELTLAFKEILGRIISSNASASAISTDSTQAADTEFLYRAGFSSGDWSGTLQGYTFNNLNIGSIQFDAGCLLTGGDCESTGQEDLDAVDPTARRIFTSSGISIDENGVNTTTAIPFQANSLTQEQVKKLDPTYNPPENNSLAIATAIGDFIRGARTNEEQNGGTFRDRENILGDIINSSPALVVNPQKIYPGDNWKDRWNNLTELRENAEDAGSFNDFYTTAISEREGMVYIGANDGMLHAFNGVTGIEEFAYIPSPLIANLTQLTDPDYTHKFYVDGSPNAGEAFFFSDKSWHTVLTGHLRSGGRMVYALDVTVEPDAGLAQDETENKISERLLWEFSHENLGYGYGKPQIVRLHNLPIDVNSHTQANGQWAAIFGNGYNSHEINANGETGSGTASIFIVNIETGDLIKQIDTGNGGSTTNTSNGIGSITTVDADGDYITDFVYGGDLNGNMWKFDLTSTNVDDWGVAYTNGGEPEPFFTADSPTGEAQAITEKPTVINIVADGKDVGVMVIFGTGKYLEEADNFDNNVINSYYGIWDRDVKNIDEVQPNLIVPAITRQNLSLRTLSANLTNAGGDTTIRTIEGNNVVYNLAENQAPLTHGWYFDFFAGELQFTESLIFDNSLVAFTTFEPQVDECTRGGKSFLYVIDAFQGKDPGFTPIDVNGDNFFTEDDDAGANSFASAVELEGSGVIAPITILNNGSETTDSGVENFASVEYMTTENVQLGTGVKNKIVGNGGRVQWRQIK